MSQHLPRSGNKLLDHLPAAVFDKIRPHLQPAKLQLKETLFNTRDPMDQVFFPVSGIVSDMRIMEDGSAIEIATIGNEGMVGLSATMGESTSPYKVVVQISGESWRMEAETLRAAVAQEAALKQIVSKYHTAFTIQVATSVACNGLHTIEKRCCRWLLMTQDRVQSNQVPLTHELLAIMLGVRRASVSEVLRPLQESGILRSQRGCIEILDREKLEQTSCECYRHVTQEFARLFD